MQFFSVVTIQYCLHGWFSEGGYRRKQHIDGESDDSESLKISDRAEDPKKEDKVSTYEKKYNFEEKV